MYNTGYEINFGLSMVMFYTSELARPNSLNGVCKFGRRVTNESCAFCSLDRNRDLDMEGHSCFVNEQLGPTS